LYHNNSFHYFLALFFCLSFNSYGFGFPPKNTIQTSCIHPWFKNLEVGKENEFRVFVKDYDNEKLNVSISEGAILTTTYVPEQLNYVYKINPDGSKNEIAIFVKTKIGDSLICTSNFKVKKQRTYTSRPGHSIEIFSDLRDLRKKDILNAEIITAHKSIDYQYKIKSYTFGIKPIKGSNFVLGVDGDKIPDKIKEQVKYLKKGDIIIIANIEASGPDGEIKILSKNWTMK